MIDRERFSMLDASRQAASLNDPALDDAAHELHDRLAGIDLRIAVSLNSGEIPAGLADRILAKLASEAPTAEIAPVAVAAPALAASRLQPARHPNRRMFLAGALAATAAAIVIAIKLYQPPTAPWTADEVLDAAISFYGRDVDRSVQNPLADAPRSFPPSRDLDRSSLVAWRRPAEGFAESNVVAYDLTSNAAGGAIRGTLYVFAPDHVTENLPDEVPRVPSTPTTQGVCAAVWRDRDLVYVLVVEGGPREYRQFLRDSGGPVAFQNPPKILHPTAA